MAPSNIAWLETIYYPNLIYDTLVSTRNMNKKEVNLGKEAARTLNWKLCVYRRKREHKENGTKVSLYFVLSLTQMHTLIYMCRYLSTTRSSIMHDSP